MGHTALDKEIEEYRTWFSRVYPQYSLKVHYKWHTQYQEHTFYFEMDGPTKKTMPLAIPAKWFEEPQALFTLKEAFLARMQGKTLEALQ